VVRHRDRAARELCDLTIAALAGPEGLEDDTVLVSLRRLG
jgi:hypothetical protein